MTPFVLVDTDVLIDAGRGAEEAANCLQLLADQTGLTVSVISQMELLVGCRNKREAKALERFLARFQVLPLSEGISARAVALMRDYRLSHGILIPDALIAATALHLGYPLMTKNQRDYRFIAGLALLKYPNMSFE